MCGRFTLTTPPARLQSYFGLSAPPVVIAPRYNIAPSQPVLLVPNRLPRVARAARWGLIPHWAHTAAVGHRMINARAETLRARAAFRDALERRRCLIPADGFYEWRRDGRHRAPFYLRSPDGEPFAIAGLWDVWRPHGGTPIASCTIITTQATDTAASIHERMPLILPPAAFDEWLAPTPLPAGSAVACLAPRPSAWLEAVPVSNLVNSPEHDEPGCAARVVE